MSSESSLIGNGRS